MKKEKKNVKNYLYIKFFNWKKLSISFCSMAWLHSRGYASSSQYIVLDSLIIIQNTSSSQRDISCQESCNLISTYLYTKYLGV